jgi:hypothetical protein
MRPTHLLRQFIYALALAAIMLSQQIASQTQSPTPSNTTSPAASNTKPNADKVNFTNNGTYFFRAAY